MRLARLIARLHSDESGQDMLEYGLVTVAVLTAVVAGSTALAADITADLTAIQAKIIAAIG
jgi:Flp pilus assembly pilin Flp